MPQVPYQPYPDVAPQVNPASGLKVNANAEAFGAVVGKAIQGAGSEVEKASDKLAQDALSIQGLQNDTWAKNADTEVMEKLGLRKAEFDQLEGQNAVNGLTGYQSDIKKIREDALASAPNPMAKRLLQDSINRRVGFALVDAGGRAGQQAKVAANDASAARLDAAIRTFDGKDEKSAQLGMRTIEAEVRDQGEVHGRKGESIDLDVKKRQDNAWLNWFTTASYTNPQLAHDRFEQVRESIDPKVREEILKRIDQGMATRQTRIDAQTIMGGFDPSKGPGMLEGLLRKADELAEKNKDNPYYKDYLDQRVKSDYNNALSGYHDTQNKNYADVERYVLGKDYKTAITSIDGLTGPDAPPEIRQAFISLEPQRQRQIINQLGQHSKISIPYTEDRQREYWRLQGLAANNPERFLQENLLAADLPRQKIDALMNERQKIINRSQPDSGLNKALADPQVKSLFNSVYHGDDERAQHWDTFTGGMNEALNEWRTMNPGKNPNTKDLRALTQALLQQVVTREGFFMNTKERRYEVVVPPEHQERIKHDFRIEHDREPDEHEVRAAYLAKKHFKQVNE